MVGEIEAIRVVGNTVELEHTDFLEILAEIPGGVIATAKVGSFRVRYQYQVSHGGFVFYTESERSLSIPSGFNVIKASKIYSPMTVLR